MHFHTPYVSQCGQAYPEEVMPLYVRNGYSGIAVTDHYYHDFFQKFNGEDSWEMQAKAFLKGYQKAKSCAEANRYPLNILLGMELRFQNTFNDYLVYGFDEEFIFKHPRLDLMEIGDFVKLARANNLLFAQAHPFRSPCTPQIPEYLMAVEVYNGHLFHDSHNDEALKFSESNNLTGISGTDFHEMSSACRGGTYFEKCPVSSAELAELVLSGGIIGLKKG
ncbi:MAG: PHP domain-containing protein [Oscillospiraceae bacterium]